MRIPNPAFYDPINTSVGIMETDLVRGLHLIDFHRILIPERWLPHQELIYQDTECPPVDSGAMP